MAMKLSPKEKRKRDRIFSQHILGRDKRICRFCGRSEGKHDTAHLIPRNFLPLRWNDLNAIALCYKCHMQWHNNPLWAVKQLEKIYGKEACDLLLELYEKENTQN
jgi:5-methylcytosine-specific restriction endonuclease McrA